jgi:hypothetical protein
VNTALAEALVALAGIYLGLGLLFAITFVAVGVGRIDPAAADASLGFRLLIVSGVSAFWPLLARRWLSGRLGPPEVHDAHAEAACRLPDEARP